MKFTKLTIYIFSCLLFFAVAHSASAANNVYYSVGQDGTTDRKVASNVTIASGAGTFTVAQTGNIGVGDRVTYETGVEHICYIASKTSTTVWNLVTATGAACPDHASTDVVSIKREFTSLSSAEELSVNASHINNTDLTAANVVLNLPCYYDTGADTTAVTVTGYTTGANNYIKIYTPNNTTTEANTSQRHSGKWDEGKYRMTIPAIGNISMINILENFVRIEGLQIYNPNLTVDYVCAISVDSSVTNGDIRISKNILRGNNDVDWWDGGIVISGSAVTYIWNNILYDWGGGGFIAIEISIGGPTYIYNNTIQNCLEGIAVIGSAAVAKNNIVKGSGDTNAYSGIFGSGTDYNATDGTDDIGEGTHNRISQTFTFADEANDDFHLALSDLGARGYGLSQYSDANLPVTNDIDGNYRRPNGEVTDIGADEDIDSLDGDDVRISEIKQSGARYSTLSSWEADRDGVITSYYPEVAQIDGAWTSADTTAVTIDGWTTDAAHYIKIYTTAAARHDGKWNEGKYRLELSGWGGGTVLAIAGAQNVIISGLQFSAVFAGYAPYIVSLETPASFEINNSIIKGSGPGTGVSINISQASAGSTVKIYNNIVYTSLTYGIYLYYGNGSTDYVYNNTVLNATYGIMRVGDGTVILKNNISYNNTDNYNGTFDATSTNNLSGPTQTDAPGTNPRNAATVTFVDATNKDFHLASNDAGAKNYGINLAADSYLPFNTDIDGQQRVDGTPPAGGWDIGADEATEAVLRFMRNINFGRNINIKP